MLLDDDFEPIDRATLETLWRALVIAGAGLAMVFAVLLMRYALDQYEEVIGRHFDAGEILLLEGQKKVDGFYQPTPVDEYDWSVAALIDKASKKRQLAVDPTANQEFSLFVYVVYMGLFLGAFFSPISWLIVISAAASLTLFANPGIRLVPAQDSKDPRRGFEALESTFIFSLVAIFIAYFAAYLAIVQNLYLRTTQLSFGDFFFGAIGAAADLVAAQDVSAAFRLLALAVGYVAGDTGGGTVVESVDAVITSMAGVVVVLIVLAVLRLMLHVVAKHGHSRLGAHLGRELPPIDTWPMSWPRSVTLFVTLFLATVSLFLFRLGALLFAGAIAISIYRMWQLSQSGKSAPAGADGDRD